jgi:polar amino acid transport system substrate-binding protein
LHPGQTEAFATLENMADDYLIRNSDKYTNITKVERPLKTKAYYLMFSHKFVSGNPQLAERIWNAIAEIKESEAYKAIAGEY